MSNSFQSIEDLMQPASAKPSSRQSPNDVLQEKIQDISDKKVEHQLQAYATQTGFGYVNLHGFPIVPDALEIIEQSVAQTLQVICFLHTHDRIRLGFVHTANQEQVEDIAQQLAKKYHVPVELYVISPSSFQAALRYYDLQPKRKEYKSGVEITQESIEQYQQQIANIEQLQAKLADVSLSEIVVLLLASALKMDSSDVHIEAEEKGVIVRFRIDGVLHDIATISSTDWTKLVSRLKLVARLKLNVVDRPQDGRFTIFLSDDKVEVRVSTIPTSYGESVVMRLLRSSSVGLKFEDLGLTGDAYDTLIQQIKRPNGMVITTGPTGSGKTTTLYAALTLLNSPETKIITLEDPIEYRLDGINQSQVDAHKNYTFANGLRSILRQDPDVIMVGEIRDEETADIAVNAALTGHMVLSTLHTNSAAGAIPRFLAMGSKAYLLAPSLNAVIGQRLVRRVCQSCKQSIDPTEIQQTKITQLIESLPQAAQDQQQALLSNLTFFVGTGCDACHGIGYKGRIGIFEVLVVSNTIGKMILAEKISEYDIAQQAHQEGMITMAQDGLLKALQGQTSLEEVFREAE